MLNENSANTPNPINATLNASNKTFFSIENSSAQDNFSENTQNTTQETLNKIHQHFEQKMSIGNTLINAIINFFSHDAIEEDFEEDLFDEEDIEDNNTSEKEEFDTNEQEDVKTIDASSQDNIESPTTHHSQNGLDDNARYNLYSTHYDFLVNAHLHNQCSKEEALHKMHVLSQQIGTFADKAYRARMISEKVFAFFRTTPPEIKLQLLNAALNGLTLEDIKALTDFFKPVSHDLAQFIFENYRGESYRKKLSRQYLGWEQETFSKISSDILFNALNSFETNDFKKLLETIGYTSSDFDEKTKYQLLSQAIKTQAQQKTQDLIDSIGMVKTTQYKHALLKEALSLNDPNILNCITKTFNPTSQKEAIIFTSEALSSTCLSATDFKRLLENIGVNFYGVDEYTRYELLSFAIKTNDPSKLQTLLDSIGFSNSAQAQIKLFKQAFEKSYEVFQQICAASAPFVESEFLNILSQASRSTNANQPILLKKILKSLNAIETPELKSQLINMALSLEDKNALNTLKSKFGVKQTEIDRIKRYRELKYEFIVSTTSAAGLLAVMIAALKRRQASKSTNQKTYRQMQVFKDLSEKTNLKNNPLSEKDLENLIDTLRAFTKTMSTHTSKSLTYTDSLDGFTTFLLTNGKNHRDYIHCLKTLRQITTSQKLPDSFKPINPLIWQQQKQPKQRERSPSMVSERPKDKTPPTNSKKNKGRKLSL